MLMFGHSLKNLPKLCLNNLWTSLYVWPIFCMEYCIAWPYGRKLATNAFKSMTVFWGAIISWTALTWVAVVVVVMFIANHLWTLCVVSQRTSEHGGGHSGNVSHKIQTMQRILVSVLHAQRCRGPCQDPCCPPMKRVLSHLAACTDGKSCSGMTPCTV